MATLSGFFSRLENKWYIWAASGVFIIQSTTILFIREETLRTALSDVTTPLIGLASAFILFLTFIKLRPSRPQFAVAWLFLSLGCLSWALGDVLWAVLELILRVEPFPSLADYFYLFYYPLIIVGFLLIPSNRIGPNERIKSWLDLGIVLLAAGLIYWNFLIVPSSSSASGDGADWITYLVSLAYPVFDLVLFAALSLLVYRKQSLLSIPALISIITSILIQIIADTIYGLQSIAGTYESGTALDLSWQIGFVFFGLAGILQSASTNRMGDKEQGLEIKPGEGTVNSLLAFAPYIWLAAAFAMMVYSEFNSLPMSRLAIMIGIGVMIALILARQIFSLLETTRLSSELKWELSERKKTQALLLKSYAELEDRVRLRTSELSEANQRMKVEIDERLHAEKELETSLDEKSMLLKEIHHRVKNNLQVISSILRLQASREDQPALISALVDSQNRIQTMALIHEKLYQSANLAQIDFAEYLDNLASYLHRSINSAHKEIGLRVEVEPIKLGIDFAVPCGLIVNELVSNALKHAFPDRKKGEILIQLRLIEDKTIQLCVHDDGIGIPNHIDITNSSTLGLQLVDALVGQLNGRLDLDVNQGSHFTLTFSNQ